MVMMPTFQPRRWSVAAMRTSWVSAPPLSRVVVSSTRSIMLHLP